MNKDQKGTETNAATIPPQGEVKTVITSTEIDPEAKVTALEAEKARLIEERNNYKNAYLKEKGKQRGDSNDDDEEEDDDERIRRIARTTLADSRLAEIAREQDVIIKQALKENKELRLAQANKSNGTPTAVGSHTETQSVRDTSITQQQLEYFKSKGWSDKDIERYKQNLNRTVR